jgi:hypothetical protein
VVSHTFSRGWNLISVPITQTNASTAAVIGDNLTNFLLFNYAGGVYVNADSVFAGKGYWLGIENAGLVDVNGTPSTTIVTQPFNTGWNLVASPFVRSYPKSKTQFKRGTITVSADSAVNLGWIQNVYYTFRQSDSSYTTAADLATWAGYFTGGLRDSLYIIFNHDSAGSLGKSIMPDKPAVDVNNWQVTIAANMNGRKDNLLAFGVGSKATDGFDTKYDYAKPPIAPVPGAIETYFQNTGWSPYFTKYGSDIRAPFVLPALGKQWSFKVFAQASGALTLSWTDIAAQIPQQIRESYSFLLSGSTVSMLNMLENTVYTFQAAGGSIYTFIINAAPTGIEQEPTVNFSYSLGQNFPNPFNPATTISYSLQYESTVQLTLYNSLGEIVRELVNTAQPAGEHTILFDANGLTSGVYYYAIKAQSPNGAMYRQSRKMVILK